MSHHTGTVVAEVGFLLALFAGVWFAAAQWAPWRSVVAGSALAISGALLIVATHWGHFGSA